MTTTHRRRSDVWAAVRRQLVTPQLIYGTLLISAVIGSAQDDDLDKQVLVTALSTSIVFWAAHALCDALSHISKDSSPTGDNPGPALSGAIRLGLIQSRGMLYAAFLPCLLLASGALGILPEAPAYWLALGLPVASLALLGWVAFRDHRLPWYTRALAAACVSALGIVVIVMKVAVH